MAVRKWDKVPAAERVYVPDPATTFAAAQTERDLLATIEAEIIPRLMLAHRGPPLADPGCEGPRTPPTGNEVAEFARVAATQDLAAAFAFVDAMSRRGFTLEELLLDLLAPAARLLGEQWLSDERSFHEVTLGLGTLQQLVHMLSPSFAPEPPHRGLVVLAGAPGEQHTLGLCLVGEFLRRAGWGVQVSMNLVEEELTMLVAAEELALIGFSISNERLLKPLGVLIGRIQDVIRDNDRETPVMIGGPIPLDDLAARTGATVATADPRDVVRYLEFRDKGWGT